MQPTRSDWRDNLFEVLTKHDDKDRITTAYLEGQDIPLEMLREVIRDADAGPANSAGAVRLGARAHRHSAADGRRVPLPAQPARSARRSRARNPKKKDKEEIAQARSQGAVCRPGLQDRGRHARRPVLPAHLFRHAQGQ